MKGSFIMGILLPRSMESSSMEQVASFSAESVKPLIRSLRRKGYPDIVIWDLLEEGGFPLWFIREAMS